MKNRNFRTLKSLGQRQAGYTLVELAISVSIISLLIVSSIAGVQSLLLSNKVNRTLTQTTVATANIAKLIAATSNPDFKTADLISLGAWDKSVIRETNSVITAENPFGGIIRVGPNLGGVGSFARKSGFMYIIGNVPETHCASLVTSLYTTSPGIYLKGSNLPTADDKVGETPVAPAVGYRVPGSPDSLANLSSGCKAGLGDNGLIELTLFIPT